MTKKWTYADLEFAVDSAWIAFENTLRTHGVTDKEIQKFVRINELRNHYAYVEHALHESVSWKEEE